MALKFLYGSVTQGGADAFAEAEIATGLSNVTRTAYRIRTLEWLIPSLPGADSFVQVVLRRNSAAAIEISTNNAIIGSVQRSAELTTSGMTLQEVFPNRQVFDRDMELLIVEETLYLDVDSSTTGNVNTAAVRIGYETRTITENERLSIQAATASA